MMKSVRNALVTTTLILSAVTTNAAEFYRENVAGERNGTSYHWSVVGVTQKGKANPGCYAEKLYSDGSLFQIIKDLKDGEIYLIMRYTNWNISDPVFKPYNIRLNFTATTGAVGGFNHSYILLNKNTINVPQLNRVEPFLEAFSKATSMKFVMPGNIADITIDMSGSYDVVNRLLECFKKAQEVGNGLYEKPNQGI